MYFRRIAAKNIYTLNITHSLSMIDFWLLNKKKIFKDNTVRISELNKVTGFDTFDILYLTVGISVDNITYDVVNVYIEHHCKPNNDCSYFILD